MTRKSSITASLSLQGQAQFKSGLKDLGRDARSFGQEVGKISGGGRGIGSGMRLTELHSGLMLAGRAAGIAGAALKSAFSSDLNVEQLAMALASVSDGTETLAEQFAALKAAAKLPGLGFTEIAKGSLDLQSVGVEAKASREVIIELGNALATTGKGKAELQGITSALSQMYGTGKVSAEEINQIAERYPAIRALAATLDKSSPAKFTEGLSEALSKLPRATATAQDGIDNLGDAWDQFMSGTSGGELTKIVGTLTQGLADAITSTDTLSDKVVGMGDAIRDASGGLYKVGKQAAFSSTGGTIGEEIKESPLTKYELPAGEIAKRQEIRKAAVEAKTAAREKLLQMELDIGNAETALDRAKASNDDAAILAAREELELLKDKEKLMATIGISEERAIEHIRKRTQAEQSAANAVRDAARQKQQIKDGRDLSELEARAGGMSKRKMDKLQKENRIKDEEDRLIQDGVNPGDAKKLAERKVGAEDRITENEERASQGLRPRIRTIAGDEAQRRQFGRMSSGDRDGLERLSHSESAETTFARKRMGGISASQGDDPMAIRNRRFDGLDDLDGMQPQTRSERQPMRRQKDKDGNTETRNPSAGGITPDGQAIIRALEGVRKTVESIGPNAAMRARPTNM